MTQLFVITGASRGLGLALAQQVLSRGHRLLTLARQPTALLATNAASSALLEQWAVDLAHASEVAARLSHWLAQQACTDLTAVTLINNAGLIGQVGPIQQASAAQLNQVLRVNLEAPMLLTAAFLQATEAWSARPSIKRRVLNISSGAGRRPIAGWAAYCASKAGLDRFSQVTALDEARKPQGARIVSIAPGVIDTDMQSQLRTADAADFPDRQRFIDLHQQGELSSTDSVALGLLRYLERPDFGAEPLADLRIS